MSYIRIRVDEVKSISVSLRQKSQGLSNVKQGLSLMRYNLDSSVLLKRNIGVRINIIYNTINQLETRLKSLGVFIDYAMNNYNDAENNLNKYISELSKIDNVQTVARGDWVTNVDGKFLSSVATGVISGDWVDGKLWMDKIAEFMTNQKVGYVKDVIEKTTNLGFKIYNKLPELKIDGKYIKILNNEFYKGGEGLARWYTLEKVEAGKFPKVSNLLNISEGLEKFGKTMTGISMAFEAYNELNTKDKISTERKISNAAVSAAEVWAAGEAGAAIGAAVGSIVPGAGTVVGAVIGTGVGVASAWFIDWAAKEKWFDNGTKSALGIVKDKVGDIVEGGKKIVGDCVNSPAIGLVDLTRQNMLVGEGYTPIIMAT